MVMGGKSVVRAWRERLKLYQKDVAGRGDHTGGFLTNGKLI